MTPPPTRTLLYRRFPFPLHSPSQRHSSLTVDILDSALIIFGPFFVSIQIFQHDDDHETHHNGLPVSITHAAARRVAADRPAKRGLSRGPDIFSPSRSPVRPTMIGRGDAGARLGRPRDNHVFRHFCCSQERRRHRSTAKPFHGHAETDSNPSQVRDEHPENHAVHEDGVRCEVCAC